MVADSCAPIQSSVSHKIDKVSSALFTEARLLYKFPRSIREVTVTKRKFFQMSGYRNVKGLIVPHENYVVFC